METLANKRQHGGHNHNLTYKRRRRSDSPPAAGPHWLILKSFIDDDDGGDCSVADAKTTTACCTSSGKPFSLSFGIAAPPACCSLHLDRLGRGTPPGTTSDGNKHTEPNPGAVCIIAGHDDAILIKISSTTTFDDYFLYEAGGGARPPSLSLLPVFNIAVQSGYRNHRDRAPRFRYMGMDNTSILRRGDDDLVVCQYEMTCDPPVYDMAELCVLRLRIGGGDHEWIVRRVPVVELEHRHGSTELQPWHHRGHRDHVAHAAVPVGNRFLCWVNYSTGFIVCDMAEEEIPSKLRYMPLPETQRDGYCRHYPREMRAYCTLGAAGPDAVRFVSVSPPRCCCGFVVRGKALCEDSSSPFNITTWTMTLSTEEATTWVKDVVLDGEEVWKWRLPSYGCLLRDKHLEYPMVSSDDPDVIYFKVEDLAVAINTRSRKLLSVVPSGSTREDLDEESPHLLTAKLRW